MATAITAVALAEVLTTAVSVLVMGAATCLVINDDAVVLRWEARTRRHECTISRDQHADWLMDWDLGLVPSPGLFH